MVSPRGPRPRLYRVYQPLIFLQLWTEPYYRLTEHAQRNFELALEAGDLQNANILSILRCVTALYGGVHKSMPQRLRPVLRLARPFLHAERLAFTHPRTHERLEFTAPLAKDLEAVLMDLVPEDKQATIFAKDVPGTNNEFEG